MEKNGAEVEERREWQRAGRYSVGEGGALGSEEQWKAKRVLDGVGVPKTD